MKKIDFYILKKDNRINSPIKINDIIDFYSKDIASNMEEKNLKAEVFFLNEEKNYEYIDFIFFDQTNTILHREYLDLLIISDKNKVIFSKYNQNIIFKPLVFLNKVEDRQDLYWICKINPVIKIEETNNNLYEIIEPYMKNRIVRVELKNEINFIIKLEVVESILRRNSLGVAFEKISDGDDVK